jgi:NADH:ubiquinone oxidoreductase subunit F (NADH-binding)
MLDGHQLYGYLPGGASGGILPASMANIPLDFDTLNPYGCFIGSAAIVIFSNHDKAADAARNLMNFFSKESCGQCTPCREGCGWLQRLLWKIETGNGVERDLDILLSVTDEIEGNTICALGDAAAMPAISFVTKFRDEFQHHIDHRSCLAGTLQLQGVC